jgi:prolipoprotein diacylglyceryltransferase
MDLLDALFDAVRAWSHGYSFWKALIAFLIVAAIFALVVWALR